MAESTTPKTYAGMTETELGFLIGGVAFAILLLIIIITCVVVRKSRSKKSKSRGKGDDDEKLVSMQTARTVDGQHMTQVIMKSQPNGNMDRQNEQNMPYQTMDPETNTVRYVTASQPARAEVQNEEEAIIDLSKDTQHEVAENDSGHGESPSRAPVDVHSTHDNEEDEEVNAQVEIQEPRVDVEERVSQHSSNHGGEEINAGVDNAAFTELEEEDMPSPYAYYSVPPPPPISESPPPPPASEPPALHPGTPVTDLDDGETVIVPPPPPAPAESIYAKIDKTRSNNSSRNDGPYTSMYGYRDTAEIQIIEKEKF